MKKHTLALGVLLFLSLPAMANHETEFVHYVCAQVQQDDGPEILQIFCSQIAWLESHLAKCQKAEPQEAPSKTVSIAWQQPDPGRTLFIFREYPLPKVNLLEPMTPIGLEVRQDIGLLPDSGEILQCEHRTEPLFLGKNSEVETRRVRLVCGRSEFIVIGLVF